MWSLSTYVECVFVFCSRIYPRNDTSVCSSFSIGREVNLVSG